MQIRCTWLRSDIGVCGHSAASSECSGIPHLTLSVVPLLSALCAAPLVDMQVRSVGSKSKGERERDEETRRTSHLSFG